MKAFIHALALMCSILFLGACQRSNYAPQGSSIITVVHAAPLTPDVDILVDGTPFLNSSLSYPTASFPFNIFLGNRTWTFNAGGTNNVLYSTTWTLPANTKQSLFLYDSAAVLSSLSLMNTTDALPAGKAALRLVHLSADAPAVYLDLNGNAVCPTTAFKGNTNYTTLDAATLYFELRETGTNSLVKAIPNITLNPGKYYTLAVIGLVNGSGKQALSLKLIEE